MYVTDPQNAQILAYSADGQTSNPLGFSGSDAGVFQRLGGIAMDGQGRLYVVDVTAGMVYRITVSG